MKNIHSLMAPIKRGWGAFHRWTSTHYARLSFHLYLNSSLLYVTCDKPFLTLSLGPLTFAVCAKGGTR